MTSLHSLGIHQGMEVNLNIKQAAANGKLQLEYPNYILSTKTTIGVPTHGIGHSSGHGGEPEHQAGCCQWKTTIGVPKLHFEYQNYNWSTYTWHWAFIRAWRGT